MDTSYGKYLSFMEKTYLPKMNKNKSDLMPSIDLGYDYSDTDKFSSTIGKRSSSSISLTLTIPIFNGFKKENNFDIEKYEYEKNILEHKDMVKDFYRTYKVNYNNYNNIFNKINSQKIIIESNQLKLEGSKILYNAGRINVNDLIESQVSLDESVNELNQFEIELKNSAINIIIYNGELNKIIN